MCLNTLDPWRPRNIVGSSVLSASIVLKITVFAHRARSTSGTKTARLPVVAVVASTSWVCILFNFDQSQGAAECSS